MNKSTQEDFVNETKKYPFTEEEIEAYASAFNQAIYSNMNQYSSAKQSYYPRKHSMTSRIVALAIMYMILIIMICMSVLLIKTVFSDLDITTKISRGIEFCLICLVSFFLMIYASNKATKALLRANELMDIKVGELYMYDPLALDPKTTIRFAPAMVQILAIYKDKSVKIIDCNTNKIEIIKDTRLLIKPCDNYNYQCICRYPESIPKFTEEDIIIMNAAFCLAKQSGDSMMIKALASVMRKVEFCSKNPYGFEYYDNYNRGDDWDEDV